MRWVRVFLNLIWRDFIGTVQEMAFFHMDGAEPSLTLVLHTAASGGLKGLHNLVGSNLAWYLAREIWRCTGLQASFQCLQLGYCIYLEYDHEAL